MAKLSRTPSYFAPIMLHVVGGYALIATLWIFCSDLLTNWISKDPKVITIISVAKGFAFVITTATLLYFLLRRYLATLAGNQEELRISEEKFQAIFNSVNDAVFIHDVNTGQIVDVNDTMCRLYKCTREQARQLTADQTSLGESPYGPAEAHEWLRRAAAGEPQIFEWRARELTGRLFWVEVSVRRAAIGPDDRLVVTVRDIEQRKQAEQQLLESERQRAAAAQAANAAKDEFLAMVSHELRTPLTPVLLALGALQSHPGLPPDCREDIAMACRHVELESRLIDDLLDLTRILSQKLSLHRSDCDVHEVIRSAVAICQAVLAQKNINLLLQLDAAGKHVSGDGGRLQQVIWNLLGNAAKFTPQGGAVTVKTRNEMQGGIQTLVVEVQDTGIGMTSETLERVFLMFEQADRNIARRYGGLGVGLAICKAIMELHGGTIAAASAGPGQGTTMRVRLPCLAL
ncbi:MAG: PAS domain-containing sensor histidine kinase [Phycisphaerae bacterium]